MTIQRKQSLHTTLFMRVVKQLKVECNLESSKSYEHFIIANKEASKSILPKKRKFE